jgi:hypothetical protein
MFESYSLAATELFLSWYPRNPVVFSPEILLPRFSQHGWQAGISNVTLPTGFFRGAILHLGFHRQFAYYAANIYIPLVMLVLISWVSFWFDVTAIEARVTLGVTTILTLATQTFGFNQITPPVSYVKAVDVFIGMCQLFVALALLEFALVDIVLRRKRGKPTGGADESAAETRRESTAKNKARRIDKISRILFPLTFFGFLIVYFAVCFAH